MYQEHTGPGTLWSTKTEPGTTRINENETRSNNLVPEIVTLGTTRTVKGNGDLNSPEMAKVSPPPVESSPLPRIKIKSLHYRKTKDSDLVADYENHEDLAEVAGKLLLKQKTRPLRVLIDCGATNNFINLKAVNEFGLSYDSDLAEMVETGDSSHYSQSFGETKTLMMKLGNTFSHSSTYTVFDLGEYDVILGMPFWKHAQCQLEHTPNGISVTAVFKRTKVTLPTRTQTEGPNKCYYSSAREFKKDIEDAVEIYTAYYKGFVDRDQPPKSEKPSIEDFPTFLTPPEDSPKIKRKTKQTSRPKKWDTGLLKMEENLDNEEGITLKGDTKHALRRLHFKKEHSHLNDIPRDMSHPQLDELIGKYAGVFPEDLPKEIPPSREIDLKIPIKPGHEPPCQAPYRASEEGQKLIEETLKYLYDHGFVRDSTSEYGAPVTLVKKPDGTWRFCVDYRRLNSITKESKYPLPRIEDCLDKLGKAKYFSKLDLRSGYWQVRVDPSDIEKTAFRTQNGHHEFTVVPFGLQGAPSTFQRLMNHYLRPYLGKFVLVYLDDVLVYSNSIQEHFEHLEKVFKILQEKQLYAKGSKCDFCRTKIQFLGYIIEENKILTDPSKIDAIRDWPEPTTVREVRSFLGLANFYRRFVEKYSEIAKPLTDILKSTEFKDKFGHKFTKTAAITLGDKEKESFERLKDALINAPCLLIYDPDAPTEVWADASYENQTIGAVLMQDQGNGFQPVAYLSKVLNTAESHYPTFEQELLALKIAFDQWRHYLLPLRFTARTDHNGLKFLKTQKHLSERQWRWLAFFSEFQIDIKYRPGAKMQVPDALSRRKKGQNDLAPLLRMRDADDHKLEIKVGKEKVMLHLEALKPVPLEELKAVEKFDYSEDETLAAVFTTLKEHPEDIEKYPRLKNYELRDDKLYWKDGLENDRIVVPCGQRVPLIKEYHDHPLGGHFGHEKVYASLRRNFYWPNMRDLIQRYISSCDACQKNKAWNQKPLGQPIIPGVPGERWELVSTDFCGPFPKSSNGNDYVMVVTDHLSKMAYAIPCKKSVTAQQAAELFFNTVFRHHGIPKRILSDRGPQFISSFWRELWKKTGTSVSFTAPYNPKANAQTERYNRTFEEGLRSFVKGLQKDWEEKLMIFEFAYNDSIHPALGFTPMYMNYGRHPTKPATMDVTSNLPAVQTFIENLNNVLTTARDHVLKAQTKHAELHLPSYQKHHLKVDDLVLLKAENYDLKLPSTKLAPRWLGPFRIKEIVGTNTVKLELPKRLDRIEETQNVSWLKPYIKRARELGPSEEHPTPEIIDDHEEDEVEVIIADRYKGNRKQYLVRFLTYGPEADEWLPLANLKHCKEKILEYWERQHVRRA